MVRDGIGYVVEINRDRTYRTYFYDNPYIEPTIEDWQMMEVGRIIDVEFGLDHFDVKDEVEPARRELEAIDRTSVS